MLPSFAKLQVPVPVGAPGKDHLKDIKGLDELFSSNPDKEAALLQHLLKRKAEREKAEDDRRQARRCAELQQQNNEELSHGVNGSEEPLKRQHAVQTQDELNAKLLECGHVALYQPAKLRVARATDLMIRQTEVVGPGHYAREHAEVKTYAKHMTTDKGGPFSGKIGSVGQNHVEFQVAELLPRTVDCWPKKYALTIIIPWASLENGDVVLIGILPETAATSS